MIASLDLKVFDYWTDKLLLHTETLMDVSIGNGLSGHAIYFYSIYKNKGAESEKELFFSTLDRIIFLIESAQIKNSFIIQVTEVLFLLEFTRDLVEQRYDISVLVKQLSEVIDASAVELMNSENYDPYVGCFYPGYYFQQSDFFWRRSFKFVDLIIEKTKYIDNKRIIGYFDSRFEVGKVALGITHGMAFYILYLVNSIGHGYNNTSLITVLRSYISFMFNIQNDYSKVGCFFSDFYQSTTVSRLSLCYGDLGVLYALLRASRILGDQVLEGKIWKMLNITLKRRTIDSSGISSFNLLYGSTGIYLFSQHLRMFDDNDMLNDNLVYWKWRANKDISTFMNQIVESEFYPKNTTMFSFNEGVTGALAAVACGNDKFIHKLGKLFYLN